MKKTISSALSLIIILSSVLIIFTFNTGKAEAAVFSISSNRLFKDPSPNKPNTFYFVGMVYYEVWKNSSGSWTGAGHHPDSVVRKVDGGTYEFTFGTNRKIKSIEVKQFDFNWTHANATFQTSRTGELKDKSQEYYQGCNFNSQADEVSGAAVAGNVATKSIGLKATQSNDGKGYEMKYDPQFHIWLPVNEKGVTDRAALQAYERDHGKIDMTKMGQPPGINPVPEQDLILLQIEAFELGVNPFTVEPVTDDYVKMIAYHNKGVVKLAIEYSLKTEQKISESCLLQELESMGYKNINAIGFPKGIRISQFEESLGLSVYLTEPGEYPYNAYDTQFLSSEFVYESTLSIRFINNLYNNESIKFVVSLVFNLMKNNDSNALFLSNGDNELSFFTKGYVILDNSSHVWDNGCYTEILKGFRYSYYDGNFIE